MLNMGELFRYPRIPSVEMARVTIDTRDEERMLLQRGDLVFARRSLTLEGAGKCSIVQDVDSPTTWESSIIRARLNREIALPEFYFYYFGSPQGRRQIETIVEQVAAAGIRLSELRELEVPRPSLEQQRGVVGVLGALDDKIAANKHIIAISEGLLEANWNAGSDGGASRPLSSLARFVNGKAYTKGATGTGRVVIRIAELNSGLGPSTVRSDIAVPEDHTARPGDLLFGWSGSLTVARWFRAEAIVNQHIFKVIPVDENPRWLVYQALQTKLKEFKAIAADKATTMGHIQRRHLDEPVVVPDKEQARRLDGLMTGLWERALAAEQENVALAATRDKLLPLLMSGKVRVKDTEQVAREMA